jgi:hypothetical protein
MANARGEARPSPKEWLVNGGIIVARRDFPVIELAPLTVSFDRTVEAMVAGLPNSNPDVVSAHFPACRGGNTGEARARFSLAKPLHDRQHAPTDDVLGLLDAAGFVPEGLPQLAVLKDHADELWAAGVYYVAALAPDSIWQQPDGGYAAYLILNPNDRGFHLHWLGPDSAGGTKAVPEEQRAELNGQLWFLVSRKERG